ncbi:MAG: DUF2057 family protein [Pseudomonadota bacterium]
MQYWAKVLAVCTAVLGLGGCASIPGEFDYASDAATAAQLELPYPLRVTSVNGRDVTLPPVLEFPYTVNVDAGTASVAFQYGEPWGVGDDNELVRGEIVVATFVARPGERFTVEFDPPEDTRDLGDAPEYLAGFSAWLRDPSGARIDTTSTGETGVLEVNLTDMMAGNKQPETTATAAAAVPTPAPAPAATTSSSRLESLKSLWGSADEDEKKAFMQWVVAPDS